MSLVLQKSRLWGGVLGLLILVAVVIVGLEERELAIHLGALVLAVASLGYLKPVIASRALTAFVAGGLLHILIKEFIDRERPSMLREAIPLENVYSTAAWPSGHTTTTMAIGLTCAVLFWQSGRRGAAVGFALLGPLVGLSRIRVGVHWPTDVIGGLCLGAFAAGAVLLFWPLKPETPR